MADWIKSTMEEFSYLGIILLMILENVFPPIPSELIMPLAGFISTQGELSLPLVIAAGTAGSVLGAIPLYLLGRWAGEERLRRWIERHGRWIGVSPQDYTKSRDWFERHGRKTIFFCRLVPGIRSLISVPAGVAKMKIGIFLLYTTLGSAIWSGLLAGAGRALGGNYEQVEKVIGPISTGVVVSLVLVFVYRAVRHGRKAA